MQSKITTILSNGESGDAKVELYVSEYGQMCLSTNGGPTVIDCESATSIAATTINLRCSYATLKKACTDVGVDIIWPTEGEVSDNRNELLYQFSDS